MNQIQNSIFEAVKLITDNSVHNSNATITIKGEITEIVNLATGIYKAKYLSDAFTVYANANLHYSVGDIVYILIPDGDFSKDKIIVGSAGATEEMSTIVGEREKYLKVSENLFSEYVNDVSLCSYIDTGKDHPNLTITIPRGSEIHKLLNAYLEKYNTICLSTRVQTLLDADQQKSFGKFGMTLKIPMVATSAESGGQFALTETLTLDNFNMLGNPYALTEPTLQEVVKTLNTDQLSIDESKDIILNYYCGEPFLQAADMPDDIFFTEIGLYVTESVPVPNAQGYTLTLSASEGLMFRPNGSKTKTLTPTVTLNGQQVPQTNLKRIYWFIEDVGITPDALGYYSYAGAGWRIVNELDGDKEPISSTTFSIEATQAPFLKYKCIVIYSDVVLTEEIEITNFNSSISLDIKTSTGSTAYIKGAGQVAIIAEVKGFEGTAAFNWARYSKTGALVDIYTRQKEDNEEKTYLEIYTFNKLEIDELNKIKCTVSDSETGMILGTASITVTVGDASSYRLVVNNGEKVYKYDANGNSPASLSYQGPATARLDAIEPLSYQLFKDDGIELTEAEYAFCKYTWKIPKQSLIKLDNKITYTEDDNYYLVSGEGNQNQIAYSILNRYSHLKSDNTILLEVDFKGNITYSQVNLYFLKDGENGTNGTSYSAIVTYDGLGYEQKDEYNQYHRLRLFYHASEKLWYYSYYETDGSLKIERITSSSPALSVKVFRDGEEVSSYETTYSWFDKKFTIGDTPVLSINNGIINAIANTSDKIDKTQVYIVQADVKITEAGTDNSFGEQKIISVYYPIEIIYLNGNVNLNDYAATAPAIVGGFSEVMYNVDSTNPSYDSSSPFYCTYSGDSLTWEYTATLKSIANKDEEAHYKSLRPIETFTQITDTRSYVKVTCGGHEIIRPIVFYINQYSFTNLNAWNGSKIGVGENEEYLLAPQIGAGIKNQNNQFTGMVMGTRYQGVTNTTDIGLFGYHNGISSFFLDAKTGKAIFGSSIDDGQIVIDPSSGESKIYGGGYDGKTKGMLIDLKEPGIHWGNGNFDVNKDGSFQFAQERIKYEIDKDGNSQLVFKDVTITWDEVNDIPMDSVTDLNDTVDGINQDISNVNQTISDNEAANNEFKEAVKGSLGVTTITKDSVISPKIGGGYLYISNNSGTSVEINPLNKRTNGSAVLIDAKHNGESIFKLGTDGSAYFKGQVNATSGNIGGALITDGKLTVPAAQIDGTIEAKQIKVGDILIGAGQVNSGTFEPARIPVLSADKIKVTDLNAFGATIGGWNIGTKSLTSGKSGTDNFIGLYSSYDGNENYRIVVGNKKFTVTRDGTLNATGATINGTVITDNISVTGGYIRLGNKTGHLTDDDGVFINIDGISVGPRSEISTTPRSVFNVSSEGVLYASKAFIEGTIQAGTGSKIGGWTASETELYNEGKEEVHLGVTNLFVKNNLLNTDATSSWWNLALLGGICEDTTSLEYVYISDTREMLNHKHYRLHFNHGLLVKIESI